MTVDTATTSVPAAAGCVISLGVRSACAIGVVYVHVQGVVCVVGITETTIVMTDRTGIVHFTDLGTGMHIM